VTQTHRGAPDNPMPRPTDVPTSISMVPATTDRIDLERLDTLDDVQLAEFSVQLDELVHAAIEAHIPAGDYADVVAAAGMARILLRRRRAPAVYDALARVRAALAGARRGDA
jgi:hypothetical protein